MKKIILILAMLLSGNLLAGGGADGGGGNGIVCRVNDEISSVELLDLYEGRILSDLTTEEISDSLTIDEAFAALALKVYPDSEDSQLTLKVMLKVTLEKFHYLPPGVRLETIPDSGHIFIPAGCKIEQMANYYNDDKIFVVNDFFQKLNLTNKVALVVHEFLNHTDRMNNVENSRYARRITAHMFNKSEAFEAPTTGLDLTKKFIHCSTPMGKLGNLNYEFNPGLKKPTRFILKKLSKNNYRLYFLTLNGHMVHSLKTTDVSMAINTNWLELGEASMEYESEYGNLVSRIDDGEVFGITMNQIKMPRNVIPDFPATQKVRMNKMTITWNGSDPDESFEDLEVMCTEVQIGK